ncbi:related to DUF636 domain protein [Cephalotrichum gorgonifer]|uniref:Related to DUF636 domain protein n=1 Tax=Cephalotrichum gorgonifer TaxID=2041049 RepID=A0AAE8N6G1_9PEZI|nr:related to DUF636 domain protein [Cephalotrichum gorgonifer]
MDDTVAISMCHCDSCRHATGEICVSYHPIEAPVLSDLNNTSTYTSSDGWTRHFCATCGCHILRRRESDGSPEYEVATGILIGSSSDKPGLTVVFKRHVEVSDTKDGGSSVWISEVDGNKIDLDPEPQSVDHAVKRHPTETRTPKDALPASCDCGTVSFHITRPDATSLLPRSNFPDLTHAYCSTPASTLSNPSNVKWWLCPGEKYRAGTCTCRSCRLISGFEIQTWAFVPRSNIHFHAPSPGSVDGTTTVPLDFQTLPAGILTSYASSPDVQREFCGGCGATVFWHDKWRPDLIDVSVGLLRAEDGARAEAWLDWWTERVSFSDDAETGRVESQARWARGLVSGLEKGLELWTQEG